MLNNQANRIEYINKLENEIKLLKEEIRLKNEVFLSACNKYNISLINKDKIIASLERELQLCKQHNAMLVLMS